MLTPQKTPDTPLPMLTKTKLNEKTLQIKPRNLDKEFLKVFVEECQTKQLDSKLDNPFE